MASFLDQNFPDEEEEDDFNPQAEIGSDDEDDEKPQTTGDADDDEAPPSKPRSRQRSPREDEVKEEEDKSDALIGFSRKEYGDANGENEDEEPSRDLDEEAEHDDDEDEGRDDDRDDDDEEEDEDDEDIEGQPSRKRRRKHQRNQFIDVEAEVDEEDEEEPEEDDDLPGEEMHPDDLQELPPGADKDDRKHRELDRQREQEQTADLEARARQFKERYGRQARRTAGPGGVVPQHLLLPGAEDPRIWRYKCRPGKERDIIININQRMIDRAAGRDPIRVFSAFERGGVMSGNLYIEANRQEDIMPAIDGLSHIFLGTKPMLIPIDEMADLLRTRKNKQLEPDMYVRIRRGLYQGDLAKVDEVEANATDVQLLLVPRLSYGLDEDSNAPVEVDANGKRKRVVKSFQQRPPPRLFSETEARKKHSKYLTRMGGLGNNNWQYNGKEYANGFLVERFRINTLQTENVNPTLEEVARFATGGEDGTESLDLAALKATLKQSNAADYLPQDKVEIFRGEQRGVTGKAKKVYGDVVQLEVDAGPLKGQVIEAAVKDLRKMFKEGDHVKVIGGSKYVDEVGMVVRVKDDRVTITTDSNHEEVQVFSKDLREATDSGGNMAGSKYHLHELVQLDAATVGVVIKVDRESLRVLDQNGSVRTILPSQVSNRLERRRGAVATDHDGNEMKLDDTVKEFGGEQKQGRVMHLHRNYVFVHNQERIENAGVFVARHSNVVTVAAKGGRPSGQSGMDLTKMNPAMKQNGAPGTMAPPQQKGRDRLIGKTVKIRTGQSKGMIGIVKDASDATAKVELHAKNKVITIQKEHLTAIEPTTGRNLFGQERHGAPGQTPAAGNFGRTPFGGAPAGGRTPAYAMASGGRTPAWKQDAGARTPAYGGGTAYGGLGGGATAYGGQTTYGGATSYGGGSVWGSNQSTWNANPSSRTPAHNPGNKTPAYAGGLEAPTPGLNAPTPGNYGDQPTPGGFRGQYQTPAAYQTPGGFPETPGAGFDDEGPRYD